jgi:2-polyprenyl-6-hydroxyphenyl methylase/3-demethylubiquinone-9 3-methyltransferase
MPTENPAPDKSRNVDPAELARFDAVASRWWDPNGEFRPLHRINPLRTDYIAERCALQGRRVLDVGCGGGLLAESLAQRGAKVTGLDMAEGALSVARLHQLESGLKIDYRLTTAEDFAREKGSTFDAVTCLEMLEHVPEPASVVAACAELVRPGGDVFFSTINRTAKAFALAIVGAEYVLNWVPRGTHEYRKFIRPSELERWARGAGLALRNLSGLEYDPLGDRFFLSGNVDVNYFAHFRRESAD